MTDLRAGLLGEALGTFLLVLVGTGSVACAVLTGALQGLWPVAVIWGAGVTLAIYVSAALSGAHLNPAVTLAFALLRPERFPAVRVLPYAAAQLAGAVAASLMVLGVFGPLLARFEAREGLVRGAAGSERAAMIFGQYFPNPALFGTDAEAAALVSPLAALLVEALGTAVLVLVVFVLTDPDNAAAPAPTLVPILVGATVAVLIGVFAPLTQAGWNPARDLGPRIVALLAGYGPIAIPGPRAGFWIYLVGPLLGGPLGGLLYQRGLRRYLPRTVPPGTEVA
jgi:glycerol uptake facilitator protein